MCDPIIYSVSSSETARKRENALAVIFIPKKEDNTMATAKKLPSGSWRCQVYDYTDENGKLYRIQGTHSISCHDQRLSQHPEIPVHLSTSAHSV